MKIIEIYEYGNGIYAEPFWDRVQKKIDKVEEEYEIINMNKKFIPSHYNISFLVLFLLYSCFS